MTHTRRQTALLRGGIVAVLAGALALTGCSGGGMTNAAPTDIPATGVDDGASLTLWTRAPLEKQAKQLVEAYNSTHKNQVELTVVPNDDYVAKVGAAAGSGGLPDLFAADIVYVPNWVEQGLFQDITAQIDGLSYKDSINKGHLDAGTLDGKEHVLPFVLDLSVMMWNKALVAEAGLDPEKAPATVADFAKTAKAVQALNKPGVSGTSTGLNCGGCLLFTWFPSVWASDEDVLNPAGTESLLNNSAAKEVYSTWKDLQASGAVAPGSADETGATWVAGFQEGNVGIMPFPATLLSGLKFDAGVSGIPGVDGGSSTFVGGDGLGISKDSKQSAQAWNFLSWLTSEDAQVGVLAKDGSTVARSDLADNEYSSKDPRQVAINKVAGLGKTPVALNFQQAFNAPGSPWLTLVRNAVLGGTDTVDADNDEITAVLSQ
ncbi:sugar ABC transporter substrate-binding protein [Microbacterium sp. Leaf179]|nr:sugar ABC transporter substrate-binding protein [Microbacterium sp. Leaf179]